MTTKEIVLAILVVLLILLFAYWHPRSSALKWAVLATAAVLGMTTIRFIPN